MSRSSFGVPLFFSVAMVLSGLAWAHTESELAKAIAPHGGLLASIGEHHVELVLKSDRVQVFVTDRFNKPVVIQDVTGTANLRVKGQKAQQVQLNVMDDRLEGAAAVATDVPVTVMIRLNIGGAEQMVPYVWPAGGPKRKPAEQ